MSNSPLVVFTRISPNKTIGRRNAIDRITPHCVVGQLSAESVGSWFAKESTNASSNYYVDKDGRIAMYVEEKDRSWCTSSSANDHRAVTIECACDLEHPYAFKDIVYERLIELCADICQRNGKTKLLWFGDKDKTLNYKPASDEMVITVHRWFANKSCPGEWLYSRLDDLAARVTAKLTATIEPEPEDTPKAEEKSEKTATYTLTLPILRKGDAGKHVEMMQHLLLANGIKLPKYGADGDFGGETEAGVIKFQKSVGIDDDGIVGHDTMSELLRLSNF